MGVLQPAMHGFTPEHALLDAKAFTIYYGLPMVAKYDKHMKEYVKASPSYLLRRFGEVVFSYLSTGFVYTLFLMFPDYFPTPGTIYTEHYFSPRYIFTPLYIRNAAFYCRKFVPSGACQRRSLHLTLSCLGHVDQSSFRPRLVPVETAEILLPH